jgi:hypothetical protein
MARRLPAACAVVFALLFSAALLMIPTLPGVDQPGSEIVSHISAHAGALRLQGLLTVLGSLALVVVLGYARDRLQGPAAHVFTIGSAMVLVEVAIAMWFTTGLALHAADLDPSTARVLADVASMWGPVLTAADVMVAVPVALAAKDGRLPRWLGVLAAIFAAEQLVETITIVGAPGTFIAPGGVMNFFVGGPLFVIFFLALGIAISLQPRRIEP